MKPVRLSMRTLMTQEIMRSKDARFNGITLTSDSDMTTCDCAVMLREALSWCFSYFLGTNLLIIIKFILKYLVHALLVLDYEGNFQRKTSQNLLLLISSMA